MQQHAIQTLLVTPDLSLISTFTKVCQEVGIEARPTAGSNGFPEELSQTKYEGVLVDFDAVLNPLLVIAAVRRSPSNRNAVIFAVATKEDDRRLALANGVNLVFNRPFDVREIQRLLDGAYELMVRQRRQYFRCIAEVPVFLVQLRSGRDCTCTTMNVSSCGAALKTIWPLIPGDKVRLVLFLRGSDVAVRATGTVIWDDKHGKTGISFSCTTPQHQTELDSWLDVRFNLQSFGQS